MRTSHGRRELTSQGRPLDIRLGRPFNLISGRRQEVRLGRPRDAEIGSLGDFLGTLEVDVFGTSWGPILAVWVLLFYRVEKNKIKKLICIPFWNGALVWVSDT